MHSLTGSYGVSGHASNDFLPRGYVNFTATDPESKQFYGYGKRSDNSSFDLAATLYDDATGGYKTYLRGTYTKTRLTSLIRSYSSSNFVSQDSTENLPYNPYERKITAYLSSYSGAIPQSNGNPLSLTGVLNTWDTITIATGSTALLHISDGSELSLGSTASQTELSLKSLAYSDDNNLVSKVSLFLGLGEVWVEAPHLRTETDSASDFSIQTDSAVAAVRGTVFGVTKDALLGVTKISLKVGKLEVTKFVMNPVDNSTAEQSFNSSNGFSTTATGWFVLNGSGSFMVVPDEGQPVRLDGITNFNVGWIIPPTSTGSVTPSEIEKKIHHPRFSPGYRPKADKISFTGGILSVTFDNPGADSYYLSFGTGEIDANEPFPVVDPNLSHLGLLPTSGPVIITGAFAPASWPQQRTYALRICSNGVCSAPDIKVLGGDQFVFDGIGEKEETVITAVTTTLALCPNDPAQPGFWADHCLTGTNSGLVAYAPYDSAMIGIYYNNGTSTSTLAESRNSLDDITYRLYDINSNKFVDNISWTSSVPLYYGVLSLSKFAQPSIYQWGSTKWIFLDNNNSSPSLSDSLSYNLTSLSLGNKFSIEMSVRGAALKRTGDTYQLFEYGSETSNLIKLKITPTGIFYWSGTADISSVPLDNNVFYKLIYHYNEDNGSATVYFEIKDKNNKSKFTSPTIHGIKPPTDGDLYVWSSNNSQKQWNDIIDYVKIFKN